MRISRDETEGAESMEHKGGDLMENRKCCGNCIWFDGDRCMKDWNNLDPCYYLPDRDDKDPDDCCEEWEEGECL